MKKISENTNIKLGIVLSYVIFGISFLGVFFVTPQVLKHLGEEQYGLFSFSNSLTSWLATISTALVASYVRFVSIAHKESSLQEARTNTVYIKIFGLLAVLMILVITLVVVGSSWFDFKLSNYSDEENRIIKILLFWSGINISINIASCIFTNFCMYRKQFIFIRLVNLGITIATYICQWYLALFTKNVVAIEVSICIISLVSSLIISIYSLRIQKMPFEKTKVSDNTELVKNIVVFSGFILLNTIVDQINNDVDKTILGIMVNASTVTSYTLSRSLTEYLGAIASSVSSVFVPKIHECVTEDDKTALDNLYLKICKIQMIAVNLVFWGFVTVGRDFVILWLGSEYSMIYNYSVLCMAIYLLPYSTMSGIEIQRAYNKHKFRAVLYIVLALTNIFLSIILVHILPTNMAVWAVLFGTAFSTVIGNWIIMNIYNSKIIKIPVKKAVTAFFKNMAYGSFSCVAIMFFCNSLTEFISITLLSSILIKGLFFVAIYGVLTYALNQKLIKNIIKR